MASEWASAVGGVWKKGEVVGADARGSTWASILFDAGGTVTATTTMIGLGRIKQQQCAGIRSCTKAGSVGRVVEALAHRSMREAGAKRT